MTIAHCLEPDSALWPMLQPKLGAVAYCPESDSPVMAKAREKLRSKISRQI
jgi:hypothetical protein